jgi:NAD-dependent dihydropyrimidine dehydrogenase PreA subunit
MNVPIDKDYRTNWTASDTHAGHSVWVMPQSDEEIHGTKVGVLMNECIGCMKCIDVCPTNVFEQWKFSSRHVADPVRENDCILCLICESVCPVDVIDVNQEEGSEDTLNSLLAGST